MVDLSQFDLKRSVSHTKEKNNSTCRTLRSSVSGTLVIMFKGSKSFTCQHLKVS